MSMVYRSKNEVVYDELHRAIIRGEYASGTRIVIDDAAAKFGSVLSLSAKHCVNLRQMVL